MARTVPTLQIGAQRGALPSQHPGSDRPGFTFRICLPPNRGVSPSVCGRNGYIYIWSWKSLRHSGRDETHVSVSKTLGESEGKSLKSHLCTLGGFPGGSMRKYLLANAKGTGDAGSIPGLGRPPGEGNGNPCQYSCQQTFMGRAAWWATVHGLVKSQTQAGTNSRMPCVRDWGGGGAWTLLNCRTVAAWVHFLGGNGVTSYGSLKTR